MINETIIYRIEFNYMYLYTPDKSKQCVSLSRAELSKSDILIGSFHINLFCLCSDLF